MSGVSGKSGEWERENGKAEMEKHSGESGEIEGNERPESEKQGRKRNTGI